MPLAQAGKVPLREEAKSEDRPDNLDPGARTATGPLVCQTGDMSCSQPD